MSTVILWVVLAALGAGGGAAFAVLRNWCVPCFCNKGHCADPKCCGGAP